MTPRIFETGISVYSAPDEGAAVLDADGADRAAPAESKSFEVTEPANPEPRSD